MSIVKGRIMIVDDDPSCLEMLQIALGKLEGHDVSSFLDPFAALVALASDPSGYDIAIVDLYMIGMNGVELAVKMREIADRSKLIIFLATSQTLASDGVYSPDSLYDFGIDDYIVKPFDLTGLRFTVGLRIRQLHEQYRNQSGSTELPD